MTGKLAAVGIEPLLKALALSIPATFLPWVIWTFTVPVYERAGTELPGLTLLWLRFYPVAFLLPAVVLAVWWWRRRHPSRDRLAMRVANAGSMAIAAISIIAAWLPILSLGNMAG